MSRGQHKQANHHGKSTRGQRLLSKLGLRTPPRFRRCACGGAIKGPGAFHSRQECAR